MARAAQHTPRRRLRKKAGGTVARLLVYVMLLTLGLGCDHTAQAEECYPRCMGTGWTLYLNDNVLCRPAGDSPRKNPKSFSLRFYLKDRPLALGVRRGRDSETAELTRRQPQVKAEGENSLAPLCG